MLRVLISFVLSFLWAISAIANGGGYGQWQKVKSLAPAVTSPSYSGVEIPVAYFDSIRVSGDIDLKLVPSTTQKVLITNGQSVQADVKNQQLTLRSANIFNQTRPQVVVMVANLKALTVMRGALVTGTLNDKQPLTATLYDKARIELEGVINLQALYASDHAMASFAWVNSSYLMIRAQDVSKIWLGGTADVVDVKLTDFVQFDAQYLRAKRMLIKTTDGAVASVLTTHNLSAFADHNSNIYMFKAPSVDLIRETTDSANAMQLEYWN